MLWRYSRQDSKVLLVTTLLVFSGYGLLLSASWRTQEEYQVLTAQSVGVFAGVEANPTNQYMAALDERARELEAREAALRHVEGVADKRILALITLGGGVLMGLILLNFYLDHKRRVVIP